MHDAKGEQALNVALTQKWVMGQSLKVSSTNRSVAAMISLILWQKMNILIGKRHCKGLKEK